MNIAKQEYRQKFLPVLRTAVFVSTACLSAQLCFSQTRPCTDDQTQCAIDHSQDDTQVLPLTSTGQEPATQNLNGLRANPQNPTPVRQNGASEQDRVFDQDRPSEQDRLSEQDRSLEQEKAFEREGREVKEPSQVKGPQRSILERNPVRPVDPPTEFQRFVKTSIGKMLPIYGSSLFNAVPSTFAPVDHVPVSSDYAIGPGDQIELRIWGQVNADDRITVDRQGNIFIPQVGRLNVVGVQFAQLRDVLRTNIARVFRNFDLSVDMGDLRSIQVFVMGYAKRPGTYTVSSLSTLVNALFASGGPSPQGSMRQIEVRRHGSAVTRFDLYDLLLRGDKTKDIALQPGDVIFIPAAGKRVALAGSIEAAAIYEIGNNTSLRDLLSYAGGLSPVAAGQHAVLERINNRAALDSENIELNAQGLSTQLADGDIVRLLQVVPRFEKTVSVKGNVADPFRLPWHAGMRVSELIPDKQALLTRDYWTERNRLTSGNGSFTDQIRTSRQDDSYAAAIVGDRTIAVRRFVNKNDVQPPAPDINWNYASIERLDSETLSTRLLPLKLGKVVLDHDAAEDVELQPGDVVTIFSTADFITPQAEQTRYIRLEGEIRMAGVYSVRPGETLREVISRAGGLTEKAYVYGAQFTRESTKREQEKRLSDYIDQLEHDIDQSATALASRTMSAEQEATARISLQQQKIALEHLRDIPASGRIVLNLTPDKNSPDSFPLLPLENGDRLVVPPVPSTVSVVGTVYNQSTFLHEHDLNVRECLEQAGGPTKFADRDHIFIIRADGSIVNRASRTKFANLNVFPGDTVVVPTNVTKTSRLRAFLDWSQVMSGLGVGAAAVNVLR